MKFTKDNWKLSVVETGIRELDIILIEALFDNIIVVTYRYAKLISGSAWRIVDSILQIELLALRQQRKLFQFKILKINPLYFIITFIHLFGLFVVTILQDWRLAFTRLEDLKLYIVLSTIWTFVGLLYYRDFVYLQHRDRVDLIIKATIYSSLVYFFTILLSYYTLQIILPASYTICMSLFFFIVGIQRKHLDKRINND
ncbi:hypothetical protein N9X34_04210 [Alphaproteobacteria bacterium]|nr:hypothetical protein [Alphaproteobacteria bacterium]